MKILKKQIKNICSKLNESLVEFSLLGSGNHNVNYLIVTSNNKYVLRIENNPQFKNLRKEFRLLKKLKKGLGPKVFFLDTTKKIIPAEYFIEEFIEGKQQTKKTNEFLISMALWLKKLHQNKKICKPHSMSTAIKPYIKNINNNATVLSPLIKDKIDLLINRIKLFAKEKNSFFAKRTRKSLIHSDLSKGNILINDGKIALIDWEFSNYNFPEYDLIYFIQHFKLTLEQKTLFLKSYGYSKNDFNKLTVINLLNACGDIGYSVWRLGLIKNKELAKNIEKPTVQRLNQDIRLLNKLLLELGY